MLEFTLVMLQIDDDLQKHLDELAAMGYIAVPGTKPQAIYMLCRPAGQEKVASGAGFGKFTIDDSKVHILRDGKLIDSDGNEVKKQ